jgi:hypothetical protein
LIKKKAKILKINRTPNAILLLLIFPLLWSSCRKDDAVRPSIEVFSPADNQGFTASEEVTITGRATDNRALSEVTVSLTDLFGQTLGSTVTSISGSESNFSLKLKLGDRYTPSGEYQLLVTVFDQSSNSARETVPLSLTEVPRVLIKPLWTGEDLSGATSLYYPDTLNNVVNGPFLGTGLSDFEADNRNQLLLTTELFGGRFTGRRMNEFEMDFQTDLPTGAMQEGITSVSAHKEQFYLSLKVPPYVRVFDLAGELTQSWTEVLYPAGELLAGEERVWVSVKGFGGNPIKTDVYTADSRQLQATNVLGWEVMHIGLLDNGDIVVAGNESGNGRVSVLDGIGLFEKGNLDLQEELIGLSGSGSDWYLLLRSGVWRFEVDNATANVQLMPGDFESMAWEAVEERIYIGYEDNVNLIDKNGNVVGTYFGGFGVVKGIDFQYNK